MERDFHDILPTHQYISLSAAALGSCHWYALTHPHDFDAARTHRGREDETLSSIRRLEAKFSPGGFGISHWSAKTPYLVNPAQMDNHSNTEDHGRNLLTGVRRC